MIDWPLVWEMRGFPLMAMARPYDPWKNVKEGPASLPDEFEGHENIWHKIAKRIGFDPSRPVQQRAPVIGGRRRYHHRPLSSWKLPGNKGTLTITTDPMEAKSWNRLKGKRSQFTPRIRDVFEVRLNDGRKYWAILHEDLAWPPPDDWYLFIDTFFRWRAMAKDALKPAKPEDLKEFLEWLIIPERTDEKVQKRRRQEAVLPFKLKKKRDKKIDEVRKKLWKDPGLQDKINWAKHALSFLKKNNIKHRDLDPSNLAKTARGKPVIVNIAESRSLGKNIGRLGRVKGTAVSSARLSKPGDALYTYQAIQRLINPD